MVGNTTFNESSWRVLQSIFLNLHYESSQNRFSTEELTFSIIFFNSIDSIVQMQTQGRFPQKGSDQWEGALHIPLMHLRSSQNLAL